MSLPIAILRAKQTAAPKVQAAIIRATIVIFYLITCSARQNYALSAPTLLSQLCSRLFADFPKRQRHTALVTLVATENSVLLPVRGATPISNTRFTKRLFQSTLPVRGATVRRLQRLTATAISIHTPRAGSDWEWSSSNLRGLTFQSTLPVRGATRCGKHHGGEGMISIHAPRAGSDDPHTIVIPSSRRFQSTLPVRGATGSKIRSSCRAASFQSTLPIRGATVCPS